MNYTLSNEYYDVTLSSLGAEIISIKNKDGYEYLWQAFGSYWDRHAPLLFPICGSLKDGKYTYMGKEYYLPLHGFCEDLHHEVVSQSETEIVFKLTESEKTLGVYPFNFDFETRYTLDGENIKLSVYITNKSGEAMPYMFGWHPAFVLSTDEGQDIEDYAIDFHGKEKLFWREFPPKSLDRIEFVDFPLDNGKYILNEEQIYKNDTLVLAGHNNKTTLSAPGHSYSVYMEWSQNLPVLCIWKEDHNETKFICIEPWSDVPMGKALPADFATKPMHKLLPGQTERYDYTVKFTK
jgi:galactose mutarotase-like enzyme